MNLSGTTVLVTGASGTVGTAIIERLLREGVKVRGLVRSPSALAPGVQQVIGELSDPASLKAAVSGVDLVVHSAAAISNDLSLCVSTNTEGTRALLRAMESAGCRALVHVSSVSVYDYRVGLDLDEDSAVWNEPLDAYGYSKAEAERLVLDACGRGLGATILRPALVLSTHPRSYWGPLALERALASAAPLLPVTEVPFVHVENLADAILLAARNPLRGRVYNVVDGVGATTEYLEAIAKAINRPAPSLPPGAPRLRYASSRIRTELGYAPPNRWNEFLGELASLRGKQAPQLPL